MKPTVFSRNISLINLISIKSMLKIFPSLAVSNDHTVIKSIWLHDSYNKATDNTIAYLFGYL